MKKLNDSEMKKIYGGGISGTLISALAKGLSVFTDIGRYVGSSIRRMFDGNLCNF